jgi:hypothetical protein
MSASVLASTSKRSVHPIWPADDLIVPLDPGESVGATDQVAQRHPQNDEASSRAHLKLGHADIRR